MSTSWNKDIKRYTNNVSMVKSQDRVGVYLILYFVDQEDLFTASSILKQDGITMKGEHYPVESLDDSLTMLKIP